MTGTLTSFDILNQIEMNVRVDSNPFGLELSELFQMGARVNPKRNFLFVSKMIGKHLGVRPDVPKAAGYLLANLYAKHAEGWTFSNLDVLMEYIRNGSHEKNIKTELGMQCYLSKPTLFIGFAETATGLAHAVFSAFENAFFVHTTREEVESVDSVFDFKEEHSHAVDHSCFLKDSRWIEDCKEIVLIDDEMSTGKTTLNLIRSLHKTYPGKRFAVLSLLDWRSPEHEEAYSKLEKELSIQIATLSLIRGTFELGKQTHFTFEEESVPFIPSSVETVYREMNPKTTELLKGDIRAKYLLDTGRFGLTSVQTGLIEQSCERIGKELEKLRKGDRTLVMGIGEFMYIPSRIAAYMGEGVMHKSTTRSPIYPSTYEEYPIYERISYRGDDEVTYYLYNMTGSCDEVFFLFEREPSLKVMQEIRYRLICKGIQNVTFVML